MTRALSECFMRIASSALTTVAGLMSLIFMSFTIGFDIGMVLSKGILISMLCVFLMMPGTVLLLDKPLKKTRHRPVRLGAGGLSSMILRLRGPLAVALVLAVFFGLYLNTQNTYSFTAVEGGRGSDTAFINERFGAASPLVILVPGGREDDDYARQRDLADRLTAIRRADGSAALGNVTAMVTTGAEALKYYTPRDVADLTGQSPAVISLFFMTQGFGAQVRADRLLDAAGDLTGDGAVAALIDQLAMARKAFEGPRYARMLVEPEAAPGDEDFNAVMESVLAQAEAVYGQDFYVTGVPVSVYDISHSFKGDLRRVNLITLLAILLIVAVSFRAIRIPVLLVFVIEGAIWITMGISKVIGEPVFFISYLICLSIQMGATIDYGILMCDQYRVQRRAGMGKEAAVRGAMDRALPTILTSGVIIVVAGYIIGRLCTIYYISSIGVLVSRGALISVILTLSLLPALLLLTDKRSAERT